MINLKCFLCGKKLDKPGALLFSPPDHIYKMKQNLTEDIDKVDKRHLCTSCYFLIIDHIHLLQQFISIVKINDRRSR